MIKNNIFIIDFFKTEKKTIETKYEYDNINEKYVVYANEQIIYESTTEPKGTFWISFFDARRTEYDSSYERNYMHSLIHQFGNDAMTLIKGNYDLFLNQYKILVEEHPFFLMYFKPIYEIIYSSVVNNQITHELISDLLNIINNLSNAYASYDDYINDTLVAPYQNGLNLSTGTIIARIEALYTQISEPTPYSKYITSKQNVYLNNTASGEITKDYDFSQQFPLGIDYFIEKNYILKQCPICMGYFKANRTNNITYCNRLYRNKLTCQEIGANIKHQEKIASNPIHSEYKKYYNKILARVKRNKISKEEAHFEELKKLHFEFANQYNKEVDETDKINVVSKFLEEMDALFK